MLEAPLRFGVVGLLASPPMTPMPEDVQRTLGRIEAKLDDVLAFRAEQKEINDKMDTRVTALEKWKWQIVGGALTIGTVAGFLTRLL